jgi:hypothetical protein
MMCVLVVSYKPEKEETAMSCVVGTFAGDMQIEFCKTGEEAINHVAGLNGWNEPGAADYDHWFIYPDNECPYESKDATTGEIIYKEYCIPMSQVSIDVENDSGSIPEHLQEPIRVRTEMQKKRAKEFREGQYQAQRKQDEEKHLQDLEVQYESLKKRLGK